MDINFDQFITYLRSALHQLYEPDQLRHSPLASILGVAARVDSPSALQEILMQAIEAFRPADGESQLSPGGIVYEVLFFRYVRGYSREAVANQLGISDRTVQGHLANIYGKLSVSTRTEAVLYAVREKWITLE